jgi:hypothetical protein
MKCPRCSGTGMVGESVSKRVDVSALRSRALELEGKFDLYDYAGNDIRDAWLDEAAELRKRADRIEKLRRMRRKRHAKGGGKP